MNKTSHYFIAIPIVEELQQVFSRWQKDIKNSLSYKIWPHQKDLHITLKFLGAVDENKLTSLRKELNTINHQEFSLTVGSIGTFGKPDSPRVLWAGVDKTDSLDQLYKKIEQTTISVGFPKENRVYRPHITLAKKWNSNTSNYEGINRVKENYQSESFMMNVQEFVLYQIFPSKTPKYERVETYHLN